MMGVMYNKGCDLVGYYWCSIFCRRKGDRLACISVHGCATKWNVVRIKYRMCFVCVLDRETRDPVMELYAGRSTDV